jgi:hypothetical protein
MLQMSERKRLRAALAFATEANTTFHADNPPVLSPTG